MPESSILTGLIECLRESEWNTLLCRADKTAENVGREVRENGVDLVLHVGDISYANGVVKIWDTFMRYIEPYASTAPYMIGIGNHEYDYKTGREKSHKHKHHTDASGSEEPYDPDWGNYGEQRTWQTHKPPWPCLTSDWLRVLHSLLLRYNYLHTLQSGRAVQVMFIFCAWSCRQF